MKGLSLHFVQLLRPRYAGSVAGKKLCADSIYLTAAGLAQSVERLTAEREVAGSIPGTGPTLKVLQWLMRVLPWDCVCPANG